MAHEKEKGAIPFESAPQGETTAADSTRETSRETERERGLFLPLAWASLGKSVKPAPFRGKGKRQARRDAVQSKRGGE